MANAEPNDASPRWAEVIIHMCLGVQPGEKVLVAVDEPLAFARDALLAEALKAQPSELWSWTIPNTARPMTEFSPRLIELLRQMDAAVVLWASVDPVQEGSVMAQAIFDITHRSSVRLAGGGFISQDILENELSADYEEIAVLTNALADWMQGRSTIHITTALGTDLQLSATGRRWRADTGIFRGPGFGNLPAGEVFIAPIEDSAEGVLVVDTSLPGLMLSEPIRLTFEKGRVVQIEGGEGVAYLEQLLAMSEGQPNAEWSRVIGELGIGTNPKARLQGNLMTDEKVAGTVHVALGRNDMFGGDNPAPMHIDMVVSQPTLRVDGDLLIENGRYLLNS
ncbi:MAG TPA: aminopeptidase [Ardenticatenaceae bacterium]